MTTLFLILLGWQIHAQSNSNSIGAQWLHRQYITQKEASSHSQDYTEISLNWDYKKQGAHWNRAANAQVFYAVGKVNEVYINLREAYFNYKINESHSFDLGRVKKPWSFVDDYWALGMWEPALKNDGYQFLREGLVGAFYNYRGNGWGFRLLATPLFLPDQGPQVRVSEGQLTSGNRWFNNRIHSVRIGEIESPLTYTLHKPEPDQVVLQNSVAFDVEVGQRKKGWHFHTAFADKPINQLFIGVRPIHNVSLNNVRRESELHLYPQVHRHHLYTTELSYFRNAQGVWLSVHADRPYDQVLQSNWITPPFVNENIYAVGWEGEWRQNVLRASYFHRESDFVVSPSIFSSEDLARLSDRYDFRRAILTEYAREKALGALGKVKMRLRWLHSLASEADMLSAQWEYNYFKNWSWIVGGDLIGTKNENNNDFFARNRSNDRIYGGMTYVF